MTKYKYLITIFTKYLQTQFELESDIEINTIDELHKPIIDFLGKSDIKWEQNDLQYTSTGNDFYITYERLIMAQDNMVLFAKKLKLESRWNELFLENRGQITAEMSVLGDEIKQTIRSILRAQEAEVHTNPLDGEVHLYAG